MFLKFLKKWGQVFCAPGGKVENFETPTVCIMREFKEETGLELLNPTLKGISYWNRMDKELGVIYFYGATDYKGDLLVTSEEGNLSWIPVEDIVQLPQFDMNIKPIPYLLEDTHAKGIFEGYFDLHEDNSVKDYTVRNI
ncbi:7,8-dihydro-8-oxoguanine triphosphatase [Bacteroidia bacterium]|nr:7,8-dihydro-8-oxoguanine triphosphatase [Clostridia bacterium]GHV24519.1 7,8-dihydro-8-oxoguanine triphosphatase [Bacteroidia bacterium]